MIEPNFFGGALDVILIWGALFLILMLRYLGINGAYNYLFFGVLRDKAQKRFVHDTAIKRKQQEMEVKRSTIASLIFATTGVAILAAWQLGWIKIYYTADLSDWWYIPLTIGFYLFAHETYYYWLHRAMHHPRIYRKVHKWHHESIHTNAFTSFSFHPIESLLQALFLPVFLLIVPLHLFVLLGLLLLMTLSATMNHGNVELYGPKFLRSRIGKYFIGATHHDAHHRYFLCNYGLYFSFWDRWMGTEREH